MALTSLLLFFKMFISATRLSCVRSAVGQPQALSLVRPQGWSRPVASPAARVRSAHAAQAHSGRLET